MIFVTTQRRLSAEHTISVETNPGANFGIHNLRKSDGAEPTL